VNSPKKIAHSHRAINAQQQNPEEKAYDVELCKQLEYVLAHVL